jgi:hypothetical protein
MYYDRTVSEELHEQLMPGGAFAFLAEMSQMWALADLQLRGKPRGAPDSKHCWATLYVGLTSVIDVHERNGKFWVRGKNKEPGWTESWQQPQPIDSFRSEIEALRGYAGGALGRTAARFSREGAVQAMLCTRAGELFSVVDREAVVGFPNQPTKDAFKVSALTELQAAMAHVLKPKPVGMELDVLAVGLDGRVLVVEVKPASWTDGIAYAPVQATFYTRVFRAWAAEAGEAGPNAIRSMLDQRVLLGLSKPAQTQLRYPLEFVPIIAIGGGTATKTAVERMAKVQCALLEAGVGEKDLEVWRVTEAVQRKVIRLDAS